MKKAQVTTEPTDIRTAALVGMAPGELVRVVLSGVGVGLIVSLVAYVMNVYVFAAVLCRPQAPSECGQAPGYAMVVAMVIGAIVAVVTLVRLRVYRPLLVVLAATTSLWGSYVLVSGLVWYWALLIMIVLFGLVYGLFAWICRPRSFILAVVIAVIAAVVIRLALSA
jgi:hypothetical protein